MFHSDGSIIGWAPLSGQHAPRVATAPWPDLRAAALTAPSGSNGNMSSSTTREASAAALLTVEKVAKVRMTEEAMAVKAAEGATAAKVVEDTTAVKTAHHWAAGESMGPSFDSSPATAAGTKRAAAPRAPLLLLSGSIALRSPGMLSNSLVAFLFSFIYPVFDWKFLLFSVPATGMTGSRAGGASGAGKVQDALVGLGPHDSPIVAVGGDRNLPWTQPR
jgi:hypothetical protein